mgnify:CR=1 FL=1
MAAPILPPGLLDNIYAPKETAPAAGAVEAGLGATADVMPPTPAAPPSAVQLDPYTQSNLDAIYERKLPSKPDPLPKNPHPVPVEQTRAAVEAGSVEDYWANLSGVAALPRKDKVSYLSKFLETPNVDISGLEEAPMAGAYQLAKLAEQEGYKVVFQSGKRNKGGTSYHDHGEAVDVRFQRVRGDGSTAELTPRENVELGKRLGKGAGWASALDEFHYWSDGTIKNDTWNSAPHVHLAWGNERGLQEHPMHHQLNKRYHSDPDYLTMPTYNPKGYKPPSKEVKRADRAGIPGLIEITARANGIDPDLAVSWVNAESGMDPYAKSPVGAFGLVQMMPETLAEVAPKVGITVEEYYKSPKAQIKAGIYYLKEKLEANGGNYAQALAAYNAGQGGLEKIKAGADYEETKNYVHRILSPSDPTISSPEAALDAIRHGRGRTRDVAKDKQLIKDTLYNTKRETSSLWNDLFSPETTAAVADTASKLNPLETESLNDPLSPKRRVLGFLNEMLNDASFGLLPLSDWAKESSQKGNEFLAMGGGDGLDSVLSKVGQVGTTGGIGLARIWASAMTGGILARSARALPVVGKMIQGGDAVALAGGNAMAEGGSLASNLKGLLKGGPLDIFRANLAEQVTAGAMASGVYGASNYFWENPDGAEGRDFLTGIVSHGMTAGFHGGLIGMGMAVGLPLVGAAGLTTLNRLTGVGSANMADNAVNVIGKQFGQLGTVQRTLAGGGAGALFGSLGGAIGDVTGLSEMVTGEESGILDSMLSGAQMMGTAGALGGAGYNKLGGLIDQAATSAFMKTPMAQSILAKTKEWVSKQNDQVVRIMSQDYIDDMNKYLSYQKQSQSHANTFLHAANLGDTLQETQGLLQTRGLARDQVKGKLMEVEQGGLQIKKMEADLDAKYPQAAAFEHAIKTKELELTAFSSKPKLSKAEQGKAAQIQLELQKLTEATTSHPELSKEMTLFARDRATLQSKFTENQKHQATLKEHLGLLDAEVSGIELYHEANVQRKGHLDGLLAKAATPEELQNVQYALKLEGPWNRAKYQDPRSRLLDPKTEAASQEQHLNELLSAQSRDIIKNGRILRQDKELALNQSIRGAYDASPEEFQGALNQRLRDVKADYEKLDTAKAPEVKAYATAAPFTKWKNSTKHLVDWKAEIPRDHQVAMVDAQALRAGVLDKLGETVDRSVLFAEAGARQKDRFIGRDLPLPSATGSMEELAKDAEAMLRMGESTIPVLVPKDGLAGLKELAAKGHELTTASSKAEVLNMIKGLEESLAGRKIVGEVKPLTGGTKTDPTEVGGTAMGQAAILDDIYKVDQGWNSVTARLGGIEKALKDKLGVMGDYEAFTNFLDTGNISILPDDVADFVKSGGDLASAPPAVQAWSEAVTLARSEEVRRLRQMESLIVTRGEQGDLVLSSLRAAQAAGYAPPEYGDTAKPFFKQLAETMKVDAQAIRATNKALAEIASGDNPPMWSKIFPLAQNFYHDHVFTRMGALREIQEGMVKPHWQKLEKEFVHHEKTIESLMKDIGGGKKAIDLDPFYKEFADAIEDTGKLVKFKEAYPQAEEMVNFYYGMQRQLEAIVMSSPELKPWVQANYLPHRFRKLAAHMKAATEEERISMSAAVAKGDLAGKYKTLKEVEAAVDTVAKEVKDAGFASNEEFLNMDMTERAKRLKFKDVGNMDQAWTDLDVTAKKAALKESQTKTMTLLLQDPVTNPLELIDMQLSSVFRADSQRQFVRGLANTPTNVDAKGTVKNMISPMKGATLTALDEKGVPQKYGLLSDHAGFHGVTMEIDGVKYKASELGVHPEANRFLKDFSLGSGYSEHKFTRYAQRVQSIFRNTVLMGTFLPHQIQTLGSHMMEFVTSPIKMMKLAVAGGNLGMGDELSQAAIRANAVRHGLNLRTLERSAGMQAQSVLEEFGPDLTSRLYGVEDTAFGRFLQSLDPGDPMSGEAKKMLSAGMQKVSDVLGLPAHVDYAVNREMLFRPIEMGQLAGFHMRAQRYLAENAASMKHLGHEEQMRVALRMAADQTNKLAGAMPHIFSSNKLRQLAHSTLLTPTWFQSKATYIADAVDSMIYLGTKKATGKGYSVMEAMGRRPFEHLPAAQQEATRGRMAKTIMAGIAGSLAMTEAAQYFADGTSIFDHPPDKWFHIRMGDEYYTGPVHGYVKDVLRFGSQFVSEDGYTISPSLANTYDATVDAVTRQLNPSVEDMAKFLFQSRKGEVMEAPDSIATFINGVAQGVAKAPLETLGVDIKQFKVQNLPGYVGAGSEETKEAAKSSMLKARHYLLRQAGAYNSMDNLDMQIRGQFYDRNKDLERRHRTGLRPLLRKARTADSPEEQQRWISQAYDMFYKGVPVRDKLMKDYYPEGIFRISDKEFESMLEEEFNPLGKAMGGSGPTGLMVQQALADAGRI